jgi:glycosyltransferase involved in cell wall biosynthesis
MESYDLTILMPCLNEAETLALCIQKARKFLTDKKIHGEILIADNGSSDGSPEIARAQGATLISVPQKGYGAALKSGIEAAQGRYIIMGDADNSYDFLDLMPLFNKLREGYDLVMGNRFKGRILRGAMPFLNRYLGNPALSFLGRVFFKSTIGDFHCGLRGFRRASFQQLNLQGDGMEFASEMIIKATLNKLKITEVPIKLFPDGRSRHSHLRPWRDGWRHLRLLLLFSPRWVFYYPGIFLMGLGFLLMSALIVGPLKIGQINFDLHTLLFSSLFSIVGLQAILFSTFAKCIEDFHLQKNATLAPNFHESTLFTLERGLLLGLLLIVLGSSGACWSFWYWLRHSFGALAPTQMMRILIPSFTFLILGMQFMLASFFFSILRLHLKQPQPLLHGH